MLTHPDVHKTNFHFTMGRKFCETQRHSLRPETWTAKFWYKHKL